MALGMRLKPSYHSNILHNGVGNYLDSCSRAAHLMALKHGPALSDVAMRKVLVHVLMFSCFTYGEGWE